MKTNYVTDYVTSYVIQKSMKNKNEKLVRKVTKVGLKSYAIVIPAEIVRELGIRERQKMEFKVERKKIIISDWK